jgi:hypothetical protein
MGTLVPDTTDNMKQCICGKCPSFKQSPLSEGFFCAKGEAKEKVKQVGCVCGSCALFSKYKLGTGYFCIKAKSADI